MKYYMKINDTFLALSNEKFDINRYCASTNDYFFLWSKKSQIANHSKQHTIENIFSPGNIKSGNKLTILTKLAAFKNITSGANMNNKLMYGTIAFSWTWKPNIKNKSPHILTKSTNLTFLLVKKKVTMIGAKHARIMKIVIFGDTSGRTFKKLTEPILVSAGI